MNNIRLVLERMKVVIEPSSAVALAVALKPEFISLGFTRVGVIFSGGNVDLPHYPW